MSKRRSLATKLFLALALCFFAAAGWQLYRSHVLLNAYQWTPLRHPVTLKPGLILSTPLRVDLTGFYDITLDVERKLPREETDCLLGIAIAQLDRCAAFKPLGNVQWSLLDGQAMVASGSSADQRHFGGHWGSTIGRDLGRFRANAGVTYLLRVESASESVELNSANPTIAVTADRYRFKNAYVNASIAQTASTILAVLGAIALYSAWLAARPKRKS